MKVDTRTRPCLDCDDPTFGVRCRPCYYVHTRVVALTLKGKHDEALALQFRTRGSAAAAAHDAEQQRLEAQVAYLGGWRLVGGVYRPTEGRGAA